MEISQTQSKLRINKEQSLTMQLLLQIALSRNEHLFPNDLKILVSLAQMQSEAKGPISLREFCEKVGPEVSNSERKDIQLQYVRNRVNDLAKRGYITKSDASSIRYLEISEALEIVDKTNHIIQLNFLVV